MPNFKPQTPKIVDPEGVTLGIEPRPMDQTTDTTRADKALELSLIHI